MPKPINKPTIAVDIDDVLADERTTMRHFTNSRYGTNFTDEDYLVEGPYWGYWEHIWGVGEEEGVQRYDEYVLSGAKGQHKPIEGAVQVISRLKQSYQMVVVTSRGDRHIETTHNWLNRHFPDVFLGVEFVPLWGDKKEITKAHICKELGASYLIDDNAEHCNFAQEAGVQALLFGEYGWNKNVELIKGIIKVKSWQEVLEYFDAKG